jgi:glycerophosphoryl diester phosphodiesterase
VPALSSLPLIAHRGWTRRFPENTLSAVRGALEAGARWVEIDVQLSSDCVPHLFHDRDLRRMCGVPGPLGAKRAAELAQLRAAEVGRFALRFADEPIARLDRFVELLAEFSEAEAFVEIKRAALELFGPERTLDAILPLVEPLGPRCRLISFDLGVLQVARKRCELELGPVIERWDQRGSQAVKALAPEVIFCDVDELPARGDLRLESARLALYEVDQPAAARALLARGADWIETFAVGELLAALDEQGSPR